MPVVLKLHLYGPQMLPALAGIQLPAGDAQLATRCPLRMNMHDGQPRAELSYTPPTGGSVGPIRLSLEAVPAAVQQAQAELTSDAQPVSDTLLQLEIWSPGAPVRLMM